MYTSICVAYDGSDSAQNALEQAATLAASEGSALHIVTVVPGYQGDLRLLGDTKALKQLRAQYESSLQHALATAEARGVRASASLREGEPCEEVLAYAEEVQADLVVVGKRSAPLLDALPVGSVAMNIIRLASPDVMVAPAHSAPLNMGALFLAYDGSESANRAARKASRLAASYGARLIVATAYEMSLETFALSPRAEEALCAKARDMQHTALDIAAAAEVRNAIPVVRHGNPTYKTLADEAMLRQAGLIVLGSKGRGGLSRLLLGSVAERLIAVSACPALVVKENGHA
ncbi:MAG: universal stress protein [Desulfovibrionaceae bacterium]